MGQLLEAAAHEVARAWDIPGPSPTHHQREIERLRAHWPALARAVERLALAARADQAARQWADATDAADYDAAMRERVQAKGHLRIPPAVRLDKET